MVYLIVILSTPIYTGTSGSEKARVPDPTPVDSSQNTLSRQRYIEVEPTSAAWRQLARDQI